MTWTSNTHEAARLKVLADGCIRIAQRHLNDDRHEDAVDWLQLAIDYTTRLDHLKASA